MLYNFSKKSKNDFNQKKDSLNKNILRFFPVWLKPNHLTVFRIVIILPYFYFLYKSFYLAALALFILAIITDSLDGSLARTRNAQTKTGAILDPLADRLLFIFSIIIIGWRFYPEKTVIYLSVAIECTYIILLFKPWLEKASGSKKSLEANIFGKIKMILECVAIIALLVSQSILFSYISMGLLWLAITAMLLSIIIAFYPKRPN